MKLKTIALAIALAGTVGTAHAGLLTESASAFGYDSIGLHYTDIELGDIERDGFGVKGSLAVAPNLFVEGGVTLTDVDYLGDLWETRLGAGYHRDMGLSVPTDFVARVGVTARHLDIDGYEHDERDFAWDGSIGLRTSLGIQGLDATAYIGAVEDISDDFDFTFAWGVSADYFMTPEVSLGVAYDIKDYDVEKEEAITVGLKYHF